MSRNIIVQVTQTFSISTVGQTPTLHVFSMCGIVYWVGHSGIHLIIFIAVNFILCVVCFDSIYLFIVFKF